MARKKLLVSVLVLIAMTAVGLAITTLSVFDVPKILNSGASDTPGILYDYVVEPLGDGKGGKWG